MVLMRKAPKGSSAGIITDGEPWMGGKARTRRRQCSRKKDGMLQKGQQGFKSAGSQERSVTTISPLFQDRPPKDQFFGNSRMRRKTRGCLSRELPVLF